MEIGVFFADEGKAGQLELVLQAGLIPLISYDVVRGLEGEDLAPWLDAMGRGGLFIQSQLPLDELTKFVKQVKPRLLASWEAGSPEQVPSVVEFAKEIGLWVEDSLAIPCLTGQTVAAVPEEYTICWVPEKVKRIPTWWLAGRRVWLYCLGPLELWRWYCELVFVGARVEGVFCPLRWLGGRFPRSRRSLGRDPRLPYRGYSTSVSPFELTLRNYRRFWHAVA